MGKELKSVNLPVETVKKFIFETLTKIGVPEADARICEKVLIESDLRGIDSHGIGRLDMYIQRIKLGVQFPTTKIDVIKDTETTAVWDGNHGMGHVVGYKAMEKAIEKAKKYGVGMVAVRNSTHYGIAGYYPSMAIENGMCGISFTNARPSIAPTFGVEPLFGTNPITFGAPTNLQSPFLIDFATSITQRGKIELYDRAEKATPPGLAIDDKGNEHTDTVKLLKDLTKGTASLLPIGGVGEDLGGYKGYGLAAMVEIFSAAFQNGKFLKDLTGNDENGKPRPYMLGHFFMAINIENFVPLEIFKAITTSILKQTIESKKAVGADRIYYAGEKEWESKISRMKNGIPINENLLKTMNTLKNELNITEVEIPKSI